MKHLFTFLLLALSISCSDNKHSSEVDPEPQTSNPFKTGIDLTTPYALSWENKGTADNYFMLGYGFDATGKYAHPAWVKNKILDVKKYKESGEGEVMMFKSTALSAKRDYEGTKEQYLNRLAISAGFEENEAGKYKRLFSATFATAFTPDTTFTTLDYRYSGYSSTNSYYRASFTHLESNLKRMREYLTDEFKADVQALPPDSIIKKYGTHLLREVYVGRRIDYLYRANTSDTEVLRAWSTYNAYYYLKIAGSGLTIYKPRTQNPEKENIYFEIIDGMPPHPNAWMIDITNFEGEPVAFSGWSDTNNSDDLSLVHFSDEGKSLIPIYKCVEDDDKREELYRSYERYLSEF